MGKKKDKAKAKAKPVEKKEPSLVGKKLTMKLTLGTPKRCFLAGSTVVIGKELTEDTAKAWLKSGHAELTADLPGPSETK
jgi:hypothetical protein